LIREYGTHLVKKIIVGGRAEYYVRSSTTSTMTSEEFELAARAKYDSLGGVAGEDADASTGSIETSTKVTTSVTTKMKELTGNEFIDTIGGTAVSAVGIKSRKDWDAWAASIASRPAFLGFEEDGLMPVWELASDQVRRTAIYQAYKERLRRNSRRKS
jgi:MAC/Perforin domain